MPEDVMKDDQVSSAPLGPAAAQLELAYPTPTEHPGAVLDESSAVDSGRDVDVDLRDASPALSRSTRIERQLLTVREAADALGLGRTTVYELIAAGDLEVVHIGRASRVPAASVVDFVGRLRLAASYDASTS
jgi:excisionase family DNA binding protein